MSASGKGTRRDPWLAVYLEKLGGGTPACPVCREGAVAWRHVGDPATRIGYAIVWCSRCLRGGHMSRLRAPDGEPLVSIHDGEAALGGLPAIRFGAAARRGAREPLPCARSCPVTERRERVIFELVLERAASSKRLRVAVASVLGVDEGDVVVSGAIESAPDARVLVIVRELPRGFRRVVSIYLGPELARDERGFAVSLCKQFASRALVSDDVVDPYSMLLVDLDGRVTGVRLDAARLDAEPGEYRIDVE